MEVWEKTGKHKGWALLCTETILQGSLDDLRSFLSEKYGKCQSEAVLVLC